MIAIRRIRPDEGPAFRTIRLQALGESPMAFGSTVAETEARPAEYWEARAASGAAGRESVLFVADDAGRWVGVIGGFVDDTEAMRRIDLVSMWVHPGYRGQGVGLLLIERVIGWARELAAESVVLWVTENNAPAISLYRRCGFRETGETQPHPSQPGLVEREMVLKIV